MHTKLLKYWSSLLEITNPIYENYEPPRQALMESSATRSQLKPLDVIWYDFPHLDQPGTSQIRPALLIKYKDKLFVVMISKNRDKGEKPYREYNYNLSNWEDIGLKEPSFVSCGTHIPYEPIRYRGKIGKCSNEDGDIVIKKIHKYYDSETFDRPEQLMSWFKSNMINDTNTTNSHLQTLEEIRKSRRANCIDIASAVRTVCIQSDIPHWVVWIRFVNKENTRSKDHFFVVYKGKKGLHTFTYIDRSSKNLDPIATIKLYRGEKHLENVIRAEIDLLRPYLEDLLGEKGYSVAIVLNRDELKLYDACLADRDIQKAFLEDLNSLHERKALTNESYGTHKYELEQIAMEQAEDTKDNPYTEKYIFEMGMFPSFVLNK